MSTAILDLPAELLMLVTERVGKRHLLALRLACRTLAATSSDHFWTSYFSQRDHLLTKQSLEVLVAITANERASRAIARLVITVPQLTSLYDPHHYWNWGHSEDQQRDRRYHDSRPDVYAKWEKQNSTLERLVVRDRDDVLAVEGTYPLLTWISHHWNLHSIEIQPSHGPPISVEGSEDVKRRLPHAIGQSAW